MYEKWLKAFHLVAAEGGVGRAARSLNVGQPTVSAHLRTLEDYFRVELFYRRGRRLELTDAGRALFNITQGLYGHESEAVAFLRSVGRTEQGRLRLGAVGPYDVVELAHAFQRAFPAVELSVTVLAGRELTGRLRAVDIDIALFADPPDSPEFHAFLYNRHPVRLIVPASHRLARARAVKLTQLAGERLVLRHPSSVTRRVFDEALARAGLNLSPALNINSREAVREAVARGMGVAVVSEPEHAPHPNIRMLAIAGANLFVESHVCCLASRRSRPLVEAFLKLAQRNRPPMRGTNSPSVTKLS